MGNKIPTFGQRYTERLSTTALSAHQKGIISARYIVMAESAEAKYKRVNCGYYILLIVALIVGVVLTGIISVSGVAVISGVDGSVTMCSGAVGVLWWISLALSLASIVINKLVYIFDLPKQHILCKIALEKLHSEGWSFISGTDRYSSCADIDDQFQMFCTRIEKIHLKTLEVSLPQASADSASAIIASGPSPRLSTGLSTLLDDSALRLDCHSDGAVGIVNTATTQTAVDRIDVSSPRRPPRARHFKKGSALRNIPDTIIEMTPPTEPSLM